MNNDTDIPIAQSESAEPFVSPMPTRIKKISSGRILKNIMIVNFFYRLFTTSFMFLLPLYGKYGKDWSDQYYGLVLSIGGYTAMVIAFFLGMVVDIRLKRTTLIIGVIFTIISAVLFTRIDFPWVSVVLYSFYRVGQELMMLSSNTFIANETRKGAHRVSGFSGNNILSGFARTLAPFVCGYLLVIPALNYEWVFTIMSTFGVVALALVLGLKLTRAETADGEIAYAEKISKDSGDEYTEFEEEGEHRSITWVQVSFGVGKMLMGFTSGIAIPFVSWYILEYFQPTDDIWGIITSISWMALTFGYMLYRRLTIYFGKEIIVVISWLLVIPAAVGIMYAQTLFWVSFFYIVRTFFAMTPGALWNSFQFEWIQPKHRGKITGLLRTGQRGLRATGTLVGGFVFSALGAALFPIAMTAYPIAGFLPLIQSKMVKKKIQEKKENEKKSKK